MAARLSDFLVHDGALPVETVRVAVARQIVYGGALDTALLEMDALAEATIWHELSHASGLPIPDPDLVHASNPAASAEFDVVRSERCRAVPVGRRGGRLQLLCGDPIEREALREVSAELAVDLELYVVPEVRLKMARQIVYGQPVPPRFVRLLGRVLGPESARRWAQAHGNAPANANAEAPGADPETKETALVLASPAGDQTEDLCQLAANVHATGRIAALQELRDRLEHPRVRELAATFRADAANGSPERALGAVIGITELRDRLAVPTLIDLVESRDRELSTAAREALVEITKQDFGKRRRRWRNWLAAHGEEARVEWLFAGLGHRLPEIRFASSEELWKITGEYFGYHHESPKRERDEARDRWRSWWLDHRQTP
jgi:hypothetical protein